MADTDAAAAAEEDLEEAIRRCCAAAGYTEGVITSYVLVAAQKFWDDDGVGSTSYVWFEKDEQAPHETTGLLRAAQLLTDDQFRR